MKCESCGKKPATVHMTEIAGKKKEERHLCDECAQSLGGSSIPKLLTPADILSSLLKQVAPELEEMQKTVCPVCGLSYLEFRSGGRLGCANDYVAFKKGLTPLLERIHGGSQHVGKMPSQVAEPVAAKASEMTQLRKELDKAVAHEEFEKAAELRDRIKALIGKSDGNK